MNSRLGNCGVRFGLHANRCPTLHAMTDHATLFVLILFLFGVLAKDLGEKCQTTCKPGSVPAAKRGMTIHLGRPSPDASRDRPGRRRENNARPPARPVVPTWSCSRWGLPCRCRCRQRGALLPHPFTLAGGPEVPAGGLLSVALSLGSPPPGVTRHRVSVEPGLSSPAAGANRCEGGHPAVWHGRRCGRRRRSSRLPRSHAGHQPMAAIRSARPRARRAVSKSIRPLTRAGRKRR